MTNPTDTTFSRALAQQASCEQLKAILAGAECADFEFEVGSGTFSTSELTMRIKGGIDLARQRLESAFKLFGFDPDAALVSGAKRAFELAGYNNLSPKYPWIVKYQSDSRDWKVGHETVDLAFRRLADQKSGSP